MAERKIAAVTNNTDKQRTYRQQLGRHSRAMREEFYFEALLIDYAVLEDRLRSLIYHMGFLANRKADKIWKKTRPDLLEFVTEYKRESEDLRLGIRNISAKIKIVRSVLLWAQASGEENGSEKYRKTLKKQCRAMDLEGMLAVLQEIENWCGYRNEVVHGLMNKNIDSLHTQIMEKAQQGLRMARYLDAQGRLLKSGNRIRKSVNLSMN